MDYYFSDIKESLLTVVTDILGHNEYLLKGGQAMREHMRIVGDDILARFSRDIDISLPYESFPLPLSDFSELLKRKYNEISEVQLGIKAISVSKIPQNEDAYFGLRIGLNFGKKNQKGHIGNKIYFKDIESLAVVIDFTCKEVVADSFINLEDLDIHIAKAELIIAEKFRALCSNEFDPKNNILPRPKDFYDIFILYVGKYNRDPDSDTLNCINDYIVKCFEIKDMPLELLKNLDNGSQRDFHRRNFQEQVIDTLDRKNRYIDITFDQVYSETLEFLDKILNA